MDIAIISEVVMGMCNRGDYASAATMLDCASAVATAAGKDYIRYLRAHIVKCKNSSAGKRV